jgi:hypothetical protein
MEKYIKVWIKTESDLPKENRPYIVGYKRMDYDNGERDGWLGYFVKDNYYKKLWLRDIDYYLQPISDTELIVPSEDDINAEFPIKSENTALTLSYIQTNNSKRDGIKWAIEQIKKLNK